MSRIPATPTPANLTSAQTFTKEGGFVRSPSPSLAPTTQVGGLIPNDILLAVSSNQETYATPALTGGTSAQRVYYVGFSDLPAIQCGAGEQPILLVSAFILHGVSHLIVASYDVVAPNNSAYQAIGAKLSSYAAKITVDWATDGSNAAAGSAQFRANAQLVIRRLGQTTQ